MLENLLQFFRTVGPSWLPVAGTQKPVVGGTYVANLIVWALGPHGRKTKSQVSL